MTVVFRVWWGWLKVSLGGGALNQCSVDLLGPEGLKEAAVKGCGVQGVQLAVQREHHYQLLFKTILCCYCCTYTIHCYCQ